MGKNQAYKAMQRARLGGASAGPDEVEDGMVCTLPYHIFFQFRSILHNAHPFFPFLYSQLFPNSIS
jgi:hypothetical protein